ncbi:MAG TPA: fused MFS/spermidine synthase [Gemmatimonadaceae bacterium]|nr:fused MFS/spermidine synthase [Gemmatimonadaceae bacterium]
MSSIAETTLSPEAEPFIPHPPPPVPRRVRARNGLVLAVYALALFSTSALLFAVEPMFTKMVLPLLGGTPAVWNSCLLFFQAALLVGYGYAHLGSRWMAPTRQALVHLALFVLSFVALPVVVARGWTPPAGGGTPVPWLVGLLTVSLGAPFLVLAAGAPILQRWFAHTGHPAADNPYFLYAASNVGSMTALLAYPFLIEPRLRLGEQSETWGVAYRLLALLTAVCALALVRQRGMAAAAAAAPAGAGVPVDAPPPAAGVPAAARPALAERLRWMLLAAVPSSLLLGVTSFLSTDVAAVPLLWVVPLALYLLTYVLAFARLPRFARVAALWVQAMFIPPLAITMLFGLYKPLTVLAALHLLAFFASALVCHMALSDSRPDVAHLTEFYLWVAVGGALGGAFNVLVAPALFDSVQEYPLALVLACLLRPAPPPPPPRPRLRWVLPVDIEEERPTEEQERRARLLDFLIPLGVAAVVTVGLWWSKVPKVLGDNGTYIVVGVAAFAVFFFSARPLRFALGVAAILGVGASIRTYKQEDVLFQDRSFFGVYRVRKQGTFHTLINGTTLHGAQDTRPENRREPLTYYHREGPLGQLLGALIPFKDVRQVAAVGLGSGTLACYGRAGERWTFYEIDPTMVRIARDPKLFTYVQDCQPDVRIALGDARLRLADAPDGTYDLILLDAFTSDAIPVHLITREALALYLAKLAPGGAVAFHISNRHLDLEPVVTELARDARVAGVSGEEHELTTAQSAMFKTTSAWVVLSRDAADLADLASLPNWKPLPPSAGVRVWTDDFSDVVGVMRWRR